MTFKIDNDALKVAMMRHYEEKLASDLRQMFVFNTDPEMAKVWQYYLEELDKQEKSKREYARNASEWPAIIIGLGMIAYGLWHLFTSSPT